MNAVPLTRENAFALSMLWQRMENEKKRKKEIRFVHGKKKKEEN